MIRKLAIVSLVTLTCATTYYLYEADGFSKGRDSILNTKSPSDTINGKIKTVDDKQFATKKLEQLTIAHTQCKQKNYDIGDQIAYVHQDIIEALEHELKQGKSDRDLLAYSNQYETYYKSYDDLLLQAKINIEKTKYHFTQSVSILNNWNGLSVIEGVNSDSLSELIEALEPLEGKNHGLNMSVSLSENITKSDVYALLDNNHSFSTYLESPLYIANSPFLSPSILFILSAEKLNIDEYKQTISLRSFTVNEVALAIQNNMPNEYLILLLDQAADIEDMPIPRQDYSDSYENLADIAVANFNVEALKVLNQHGVKPTNEPGIMTAMDIAIMNLPSEDKVYKELDSDSNKYLNTLTYLKENGYKAHGKDKQFDSATITFFRAPGKRQFNSHMLPESKLRELIQSIELIDKSHNIKQRKIDDSIVSAAIAEMKIKQMAFKRESEACVSIKQQLLAEEGFESRKKTYQLIDNIKKNPQKIEARLQEIDPVLVSLWKELELNAKDFHLSSKPDDEFRHLLNDGKTELALEYSILTPLTLSETDTLFRFMLNENSEFAPIWKARIEPKTPSSLISLKHLPVEKWQDLLHQGFDFSITDQLGNDAFMAAALNSSQAIRFLVDNNFKLNTEKYGLDALDLLLEQIYESGKLTESITELLTLYPEFKPSHYARVARIKKFLPDEYNKLISLNNALTPEAGTKINKFRIERY
ncbi:hypothetical protein FM038_010645 [Shewanella eurypsychrophilus]|uniref:Ankyrin repeat domain-containing protein n=1 Tax=Shewanella eurypsychrophilus TaxID=2593656 RepID=A0ABX6V5M9_9GAMM|nr:MULTISPECIES: hypothetical protein [Shewanella]QFU22574.1 hypothetical protein FS418_12225 [Shewanella sp. YLB-09]QPG57863.1 hypothetical protein FM038_010645 [Shewanella eurypsychrophilus]